MRQSSWLRIALIATLVASLLVPSTAVAYKRSDVTSHQKAADAARKKAAAEQKKADALLAQTKQIEDRISSLASEISSLGGQIGTASERRTRLDDEIALIRTEVTTKQTLIAQLQSAYDSRTAALAARADESYRSGDWGWLEVLLSSQDFGDFIQRAEYVNLLIADDEQAASELESTRTDLQTAKAELNRSLETLQAKRDEVRAQELGLQSLKATRDSKRSAAETARAQKSALLAQTKKNIARLRAMALAEEQESARIAKLLRKTSSHGSGTYNGRLTWPTPGHTRVTSPFGYRVHPILHVRKLHTGIDIGAPAGAQIVAAGSGTVIFAGSNGGYGNCTMIDHGNGLVTLYGHQSRIVAYRGQHVSRGTTIGYVGSTGLATGPHLHFEVRVNGTPHNPMSYL